VLITTPTKEENAIDSQAIEAEIEKAVRAANKDGVTGSALTKYLMRVIDKATEGRSAKANMAVLINTAEVAGRLAAAHAQYRVENSLYQLGNYPPEINFVS